MRNRPLLGLIATAAVLFPGLLSAQETQSATGSGSSGSDSWSFSFIADGYIVPDSSFFVSPMLTADHDWLHLEGRYNYEDHSTGSIWFGYKFRVGQRVLLEATPMIGGVFGKTAGVAPGYELSLSYRRLTLSDTGEYVFNAKDRSGSFYYAWPQLEYSLVEWLNVGFAAQRTKAYHTDFDVQRGALVGIAFRHVELTTYVFAGHSRPTVVLEEVVSF